MVGFETTTNIHGNLRRLRLLAWKVSVWLLLVVCAAIQIAAAEPLSDLERTEFVYKTVAGRELKLYVVKPESWKPVDRRPAIVFFHGGGWSSGTPVQFRQHSQYLASRGMVTVEVEYRLLDPKSTEPPVECVQDAKSAMRWVRGHADQLGIDPQRIAAGGGSAGGHLAAFVGMVAGLDDPQDDMKISAKADAMVLFNPVFDNGPGSWGYERVGDRYREFSPFHNVSADDPPSIVFLGSQDTLIPVKTVEDFKSAMEKAGVRCETIIYKGQKHGFFNARPDNRYYGETLVAADRFLASLGWLSGPPTLKTSSDATQRGEKGGQRPPNIIVILVDDLGYADLGCHGSQDILTPHIDSLAKHGVRCTNAYASHPVCSPTRAGLMTGRYQQRFGHENNPAYEPKNPQIGLPTDEVLLPQVLQSAGYATAAVGKWHLGAAENFHPNRRGFDEFFGFLNGGRDYVYNPARVNIITPILRNEQRVTETDYLTNAFTREATDFIVRQKTKPFFLYLAYNAVHAPLQATDQDLARFEHITDIRRRTYAAMTSALDEGVGRVLQTLRNANLENNTLIFFLSDNGGPPASNAASNFPLRGAKGQLYEGGIRVPLLIQWRGKLPEGVVYDQPVSSLDVFPTAVAAASASLPSDRRLDGVNLLLFLSGADQAVPHETLFWRTFGGRGRAVRQGRYKAIGGNAGLTHLFNLETDPAESKDLAQERPETLRQLALTYEAWNAELISPLWPDPDDAVKK